MRTYDVPSMSAIMIRPQLPAKSSIRTIQYIPEPVINGNPRMKNMKHKLAVRSCWSLPGLIFWKIELFSYSVWSFNKLFRTDPRKVVHNSCCTYFNHCKLSIQTKKKNHKKEYAAPSNGSRHLCNSSWKRDKSKRDSTSHNFWKFSIWSFCHESKNTENRKTTI